jgi:hypothetical protein
MGSEPDVPRAARTSRMAVASVVCGVLGFTCLPAIGGVLAVALGIVARGEIERSNRELGGGQTAIVGIVLGAINAVLCVIGLASGLSLLAEHQRAAAPTISAPPRYSPPSLPSPPAAAPSASSPGPGQPSPALKMSRDEGVIATRVGQVDLIDVGTEIQSLTATLELERTAAQRQHQKLLLWLVVADCQPCNGVAAALPDPLMQQALADMRLVRLDVREFGGELTHLGVPVERGDGTVVVPAFVLLDDGNRPVDYVHGGEWDADVPRNIAPVLREFVRGRYKQRRHQWHRGHRGEGLPL